MLKPIACQKEFIKSCNSITDGAIHQGQLRAGNLVSVDHFEYRLKGRTYQSMCRMTADRYVGGCIFVDSMSSFLHVEHQLGFSGLEIVVIINS